jgi:hypothetical protein
MDIRVPMAPIVAAFGLDIQVTRPAPDDTPVPTTGVWIPPPLEETRPVGTDFQRHEPRRCRTHHADRSCWRPKRPAQRF